MKLLADCGSTTINWAILDKDSEPVFFNSDGINPVHMSANDVYLALKDALVDVTTNEISEVWFYGAGIVGEEIKEFMQEILARFFPLARLEVDSDLMAAARAGLDRERGIACILGTGSNSCLYDGEKIIEHVSPLGYILGDEGSGAVMGRKLVGDYLKKMMPHELQLKFKEAYPYSRTDYLNLVYKQVKPNQFLAGLTKFLVENSETEYCYQFVYSEFDLFIQRNILGYTDYNRLPISFVGSVGFYFKEILLKVLADYGLVPGNILKDPLNKLILFHRD